MSWFLGLDTSNYTTSVACWNSATDQMVQSKKKLPVSEGQIGLRQSDAVFAHTSQLGNCVEELGRQIETPPIAVGVSTRPRDIEGSYMPCFLVGKTVAQSVSALLKIPHYSFSHQSGHIAAVLYATKQLQLIGKSFIAFHLSGGTTECVLVEPGSTHPFQITLLADSLDLYAGQCVDRVGHLLGIPFPAGPALEKLALQCSTRFKTKPYFKDGNPSISGLENQCKQRLEQGAKKEEVAKFCLDWLTDMVATMTQNAKKKYPNLPIIYAGGVLSNSLIQNEIKERFGGYFAPPEYSADNAAGIAVLAGFSAQL